MATTKSSSPALRFAVFMLWIAILPATLFAQYSTLSFQGLVTDGSGVPLTDGNHDFEFRIYTTPTGAGPLWVEAQNLAVSDGIVNATLGNSVPIDLPFDEPYYLSVIVPPDTIYPRTLLTSAPYSMAAKTLTAPATITGSGGGTALTVTGSSTAAYLDGNVFVGDSLHVFSAARISQYLVVHQNATILGGLSAGDLQAPAGGDVGVGTSAPTTRLHVVDDPNGSASFSNHVAGIDNTSTGTSADVLALRVGRSTAPDSTNSYITFKYNGNASAGFIRGNGDGGIELVSSGADYAEYLPHLDANEQIEPGDVVGVSNGSITRRTDGAQQIMVVSTAPIVVGNHSHGDGPAESRVAFLGQTPVKVEGPVNAGDLLIPSGRNDGTAVGMNPRAIQPEQVPDVLGTAWESSHRRGVTRILAAIGIDQRSTVARVLEAVREREQQRDAELESLRQRLEALEARLNL